MRSNATPPVMGWTPPRLPLHRRVRRPAVSLRLVIAILVLPLVLGLGGPPSARGDELSDAIARQKALAARIKSQRAEVAKLKAQQASLSGEIVATRSALSGINANLDETQALITRLGKQIGEVRSTYDDLVGQVVDLDREVASVTAEEGRKATELRQRKALLASRLREAYRTDRTPLVQTLVSAGSFTDLLQDVGSYLDYADQDRALAERIKADSQTLEALRGLLTDTLAARQGLRDETLAQKHQLDADMADLKDAQAAMARLQADTARELGVQRAAYDRMARNESALQAALAASVAAQKKLAAEVAKLVARQRDLGNIPSVYNGTLSWPMSGTVTQEFGCTGFSWEPRVGSCAHFHQGIDIAAPMYTPIRAAGPGVVVWAGRTPWDSAWIVIIAHSSSLVTWYAHIDNRKKPPAVRVGDRVVTGQVIAYEGMTGNTTGPHLHWAVLLNGSFKNPRLFL